jgi:hypothetical protein
MALLFDPRRRAPHLHAYLQLIRLKEGTVSNAGNIIRFAKRKHIEQPEKLKLEELQDRLQFCRIRHAELRKQAKGLQKVHLRDCLLDAQSKKQYEQAKAIKQKLNQEESKRMWYLIQRTVKDHHSPSVLRVQRVGGGTVKEYTPRGCGAGDPAGMLSMVLTSTQHPHNEFTSRREVEIPIRQILGKANYNRHLQHSN